jgi:DNA-binding CsgD family transcriptional regulator
MLEVDWERTPLGSPATWPQSLRSVVHVVLTSRFSMWMGWGPDVTFFCNDKYRRDTLATKYPWALGRPAAEVWAEIWTDIGPRIESVLETGVASWDESLQLILERGGYPEETYHTFSYSPLSDESGAVAGILCVVSEETERVVGDRRMNVLRRLGTALTSARTEEEVLDAACQELASDQTVLPFALLYKFEGEEAGLICAAGATPGEPIAPERVSLEGGSWPVASLLKTSRVLVDDLDSRFAVVPRGAWREPATSALLVRVGGAAGVSPFGVLVAGLNRYRLLDEEYQGFLDLVANQIGSSMSNARAFEVERQRAEDLAALDRARRGERWLSPVTTQQIRPRLVGSIPGQAGRLDLGTRELEILKLLAGGYSNKEIARSLSLAEGTVKNYVSDILAKLGTRDRTRAVLKAITLQLV